MSRQKTKSDQLMRWFNTLWAKIALKTVFMIVIMMGMVTYIYTISQINTQRQELRQNMGHIAKQIASIRLAETEGYYVYQEWIDNIISSDFSQDLVYIAIFDEQDQLQVFSINYAWLDLGSNTFLSRARQAEIVVRLANGQVAKESQSDFDHIPVEIRWGDDYLGKVDVGFSLVEFNNEIRRRFLTNVALLALFSFVGVVVSVVMGRKITSPLNRLSFAMRNISRGHYNQSVEIKSNDEIGQLAQSFNLMTEGLKDKRLIEQFSQALSFHFELNKIRQLTIDYLVQAIGARGGFFYCFDGDAKKCTLQAVCGEVSSKRPRTFSITDYLSKTCLEHRVCYAVDPESGIQDADLRRFDEVTVDPEVELVLSVISKETLLALIFLYGKSSGEPYTNKDEHFIKTLSEQASLALENAALLEELTEQERLKRELEIARQVQIRLLPGEMPTMDGMDISGICQPATEVGGDYYDFFSLDDHRLGIAIADVSGKGTSAAFYMAEIKGMMSSLTLQVDSPREILCALNERLYQSVDRQVFATMIYAVIDLEKDLLTFVRAGHNGLLVKRSASNQVLLHIPSGIGLGLTDSRLFDLHLEEESIRLNPDDTIVFYTDGVSEAMDGLQKEYGEDALIDLVKNTRVTRAIDLQETILQDLNRFVGDRKQHDDITMVIAHLNDAQSTLRKHRAKQKQSMEELTGQPLG